MLVQLGDALIAPGAAAGAVRYVCVADAGPRHLEDCAHGNAHGPAVQRVVAGGADEYGVYSEGGRAAEDGPHVRVVRDVLQHRYQARLAQHVGNGRKRGASEGPQGAARQLEAGEPLELVMGRHEHRQLRRARPLTRRFLHARDEWRHGGQPLLFHEKRDRLHTAFEGPLDHLARLGDEQRPLRLQLAAQLSLGQPRERIEPRVIQRVYIDKGHDVLSLSSLVLV